MISNKVYFRLYERSNSFRKSGKEFVLSVQFVDHEPWVIKDWEQMPSQKTVDETKQLAMRCFEFYHRHLQIPSFNVTQVDI